MPTESTSLTGEGGEPAWNPRAIEDEADEGLLLAEYATRMRLKNRIIVDTMTAGGVVDPEAWADEARLSLGRLRIEAETSARRVARERDAAAEAKGRARHQHDYRARDTDNLDRRGRVYRLLARRLLSWENSEPQIAALLAAARRDAAEEMDAALTVALANDGATRVEDEALLRERLRLIVDVDLPALRRAAGSAAGPEPEPEPGPGPAPTAPAAPPAPIVPKGPLRRLAHRLRIRREPPAGKRVPPPR